MAYNNFVTEVWVKQVAQALSKKFNVSVRKGKGWSADIDKKILYYGPEIYLLSHNQALGLLTHEVAHLRHTTEPRRDSDIAKKYPTLNHEGVNCLEDRRIEHIMGNTFPGAKEAIAMLNQRNLESVRKSQMRLSAQVLEEYDERNEERVAQGQFAYSSIDEYAKDRRVNRSYGDPSQVTETLIEASLQYMGVPPITDYWNPEIVNKATQIAEIMRKGNIEQMKSTQEIADFWTQNVAPVISDYFTVEQNQQQQGATLSAGDDSGNKNPETPEWQQESMSQRIRKTIDKMHEDETGINPGTADFRPGGMNYLSAKAELRDIIVKYGAQFKRVLKDNLYDRWSGKHLSGRLDMRKLYRHKVSGDMRLFKRKVESDKKDFSFTVLCDVSGSMNGTRIRLAKEAMVILNEVLTFCEIPTSVYAFNGWTAKARGLGEKTDPRQFAQTFGRAGGGTDMKRAYKESVPPLVALGRKNKVHICITDGGVGPEDIECVKEFARKHKDVAFYGIGIDCSLEHIYPATNYFSIQDASELMPVLMRILRRHIVG